MYLENKFQKIERFIKKIRKNTNVQINEFRFNKNEISNIVKIHI